MALNIQGNITTDQGISLSSVYSRVEPILRNSGNDLVVVMETYVDRAAFESDKSTVSFESQLMLMGYPYDRASQGTDLLMIAHENTKANLEALGYTVEIVDL